MTPLADLRVVDLGIITAGAGCTALLADFGADVVKVESGKYPDPFRYWSMGSVSNPGESINASGPFNAMNRNKRGICLDIKTEAGRAALLRLIARADLVVENFRRGVLDRLGLSYAAMQATNPAVVLLSVTSQGDVGPERGYASYGSTLDAISGLMSVTGYDSATPAWSGADVNYPDQYGALFSAGLALAAVRYARRSGRGGHVVISQREMVSGLIAEHFLDHALNGAQPVPSGNTHPLFEPQGCFACAGEDNWLALSIRSDLEWARFAPLIDAADPRFATAAARREQRAEITRRTAAWCARQDKRAAARQLQALGIAAGAVLTPEERHDDPQLRARDFFRTIRHPESGPQLQRGAPFRLGEIGGRPAPMLGEHSSEILREAGFSEAEIAALDQSGVTTATVLQGRR